MKMIHTKLLYQGAIVFIICLFFVGCILFWKGSVQQEMEINLSFNTELEKGYFNNGLGITNIGDPFVLKISDDCYYLYCTSAPNGFYCWTSKDMVNWTDKKMCYTRTPNAWCTDCFWAPEVVAYESKYYMYYTAKNQNGSLRIGLAISDTPDGPFLDVKNEPFFDFGYAAIDANVLIDDDGSKYLYYARDCSENIDNGIRKSEIYGVKLSHDLLSTEGEAIKLLTPEQKWEVASGDTRWNEGPEIIKHNKTYYLTYSANYFASPAYSVGYATSNTPLGPFTKAEENPILTSGLRKDVSGTGHHSFTTSPDSKELWTFYHSHTDLLHPGGNRKVNMDRAGFTEDGKLYINGPLTSTQPTPSGTDFINLTDHFLIDMNLENAHLLIDGFFSVYKKHLDKDLILPTQNEEPLSIHLKSNNKNRLTGICIYPGQNGLDKIASLQLRLGHNTLSEIYSLENEAVSPIILSFDPVTADSIELIITPAPNADSVILSEIMLLGENNTSNLK